VSVVFVLVDTDGKPKRCGLTLHEATRPQAKGQFTKAEWNSLWAAEDAAARLPVYASKGWKLLELPIQTPPMSKPTPFIAPQHLSITLLCEYQKQFNVSITEFEMGHKLVGDMWNALFVCTSKKNAVLHLKEASWETPGHILLTFMSRIWMYKPHVAHHEAAAELTMAVNKF